MLCACLAACTQRCLPSTNCVPLVPVSHHPFCLPSPAHNLPPGQVIPPAWLCLFSPREVNQLLGGGDAAALDVEDMQAHVAYRWVQSSCWCGAIATQRAVRRGERTSHPLALLTPCALPLPLLHRRHHSNGYSAGSTTVKHFWAVVRGMSQVRTTSPHGCCGAVRCVAVCTCQPFVASHVASLWPTPGPFCSASAAGWCLPSRTAARHHAPPPLQDEQRALLKFVTSCSRAPLGGFCHLTPPLTIHRVSRGSAKRARAAVATSGAGGACLPACPLSLGPHEHAVCLPHSLAPSHPLPSPPPPPTQVDCGASLLAAVGGKDVDRLPTASTCRWAGQAAGGAQAAARSDPSRWAAGCRARTHAVVSSCASWHCSNQSPACCPPHQVSGPPPTPSPPRLQQHPQAAHLPPHIDPQGEAAVRHSLRRRL